MSERDEGTRGHVRSYRGRGEMLINGLLFVREEDNFDAYSVHDANRRIGSVLLWYDRGGAVNKTGVARFRAFGEDFSDPEKVANKFLETRGVVRRDLEKVRDLNRRLEALRCESCARLEEQLVEAVTQRAECAGRVRELTAELAEARVDRSSLLSFLGDRQRAAVAAGDDHGAELMLGFLRGFDHD